MVRHSSCIRLVVFAAIMIAARDVAALTAVQSEAVKDTTIELCRGGTIEGEAKEYIMEAGAEIRTLIFKRLMDMGIEGKIKLSGETWNGIEALTIDGKDYHKCVEFVVPLLTDRLNQENLENLQSVLLAPDMNKATLALQSALYSKDPLMQRRALRHLLEKRSTLSGTWASLGSSENHGVFGFVIDDMKDELANVLNFTGTFDGESIYYKIRNHKATGSLSGNELTISNDQCALQATFDGSKAFVGEMECVFFPSQVKYTGVATVTIPIY